MLNLSKYTNSTVCTLNSLPKVELPWSYIPLYGRASIQQFLKEIFNRNEYGMLLIFVQLLLTFRLQKNLLVSLRITFQLLFGWLVVFFNLFISLPCRVPYLNNADEAHRPFWCSQTGARKNCLLLVKTGLC